MNGAKKKLEENMFALLFVFDVPTESSSMTINVWIFSCAGITTQENNSVSHNILGGIDVSFYALQYEQLAFIRIISSQHTNKKTVVYAGICHDSTCSKIPLTQNTNNN